MTFYSPFVEYYELIFPFKATTFRFLESFVSPPKSRILDIGCGTGAYPEEFARKKHDATGIDIEPAMISYAEDNYHKAHFKTMGMMDIGVWNEEFSLAYSIGNVVSHLPGDQWDNYASLMKKILIKNGFWILQTVNWDRLLPMESYRFPVIERENGRIKFYRRYLQITAKNVIFEIRLSVDNKEVFVREQELFPITSEEIINVHKRRRFILKGHFGDFQKSDYKQEESAASVFVFQK